METIIVIIAHRETEEILAQGPKGWGFHPFDSGYYIFGQPEEGRQ